MSVTPIFLNEAFDPQTLCAMGSAFDRVCKVLGLVDRIDGMTEIVAMRVIEQVRMGVRDPEKVATNVLAAYRVDHAA